MFYMKMKQSSYLKILTLLTAILLTNNFSIAEELKCKTLFETKKIDNAISKGLNSDKFPIWIERNNKKYEIVYLDKNGGICNLDLENIVYEGKFIPLSKLGYYDDIYIEGSNPYIQLFFPIYKTFVKGKAVFNIEISPIVKEDSVIAVKINDKIVKVIKLKDFGYTGNIEVPIIDTKDRKFIKISLDGDLKVGRNICDDINAKNIYLKINPEKSGFYVIKDVKVRDIKSFFFDYTPKFYINELNPKSLKLFYYLPSSSGWIKADVNTLTDLNIPKKLIEIEKDGSFAEINEISKGFTLTVANPDIISNFILKSALLENITDSEIKQSKPAIYKNVITLKELGATDLNLNGVGILSFYIPFNTAEIGGLPDKLRFYMFISHSAIDKHDRAFLEVYVNNTLIRSYQLKDETSGRKGYIVDIPKSLLGAGLNNVVVKVSYYPSSDRCIGAVPKINVSLDSNSYFEWNSTKKEVYKVRDFVNIVNGKVAVVVNGKLLLKPAARFLEILGKINPNITNLDVYTKISELDPSKYDYIIMFLSNKEAKKFLDDKNVPLKLDERGFSIIDIQNNKKLFTLKSNESIGFMEVFQYKGKSTLLVSYLNNPSVLEGINLFNPVNINSLLGNLVLFNNEDYSVYNIGDFITIEYISEKNLLYYWNNYKVLIISVLVILVILFEIFVIRKLVKTKGKK